MTDTQELLQERIQLFKDAARHKKTDRVLNLANFWTWKILDAGYTISDATRDYDKMEDVQRQFQEKYHFDLDFDALFGVRDPLRIADALGAGDYTIEDEEAGIIHFESDICYMEADEYDEVATEFTKFLWTKLMPRKFEQLKGTHGKEMVAHAVGEVARFLQFGQELAQALAQDYGVPPLAENFFLPFFEELANIRGIKELSLDLHRRPQKVHEACEAHGVMGFFGGTFESFKEASTKGTNMHVAADIGSALLAHSLCNPKQFGDYLWPYLEELFDFAAEYDKIVYIFAEHNSERFYDFYKQVPKGVLILHPEMDDIFKAKEKIGDNVCLAGGMPASLLYHGTKQENIDYAKRLIDELAADGGYIFSQNKMISYPNDCKAENLKAVNDFVREYRI
ncbi:MAG: uroporphyrinogen decarboxylase family protein [bacterium]